MTLSSYTLLVVRLANGLRDIGPDFCAINTNRTKKSRFGVDIIRESLGKEKMNEFIVALGLPPDHRNSFCADPVKFFTALSEVVEITK